MTVYKIKRIYESPESDDGYRVLVDRLWPRGISKERAALDEWAKDIAPTNELRQWFGHDPEKFAEFASRYTEELDAKPPLLNNSGKNIQLLRCYIALKILSIIRRQCCSSGWNGDSCRTLRSAIMVT